MFTSLYLPQYAGLCIVDTNGALLSTEKNSKGQNNNK
jgi:hypothetical protein